MDRKDKHRDKPGAVWSKSQTEKKLWDICDGTESPRWASVTDVTQTDSDSHLSACKHPFSSLWSISQVSIKVSCVFMTTSFSGTTTNREGSGALGLVARQRCDDIKAPSYDWNSVDCYYRIYSWYSGKSPSVTLQFTGLRLSSFLPSFLQGEDVSNHI